jgi:hypothetical protein
MEPGYGSSLASVEQLTVVRGDERCGLVQCDPSGSVNTRPNDRYASGYLAGVVSTHHR